MPLVFGGAPVVNTFVELTLFKLMGRIGPIFVAGLIMTAAGAVTVLVFAPRSHAPAHGAEPASSHRRPRSSQKPNPFRGPTTMCQASAAFVLRTLSPNPTP